MAVGKKSIMRAEHSAKEMNHVNTTEIATAEILTTKTVAMDKPQEVVLIQEEKFRVISSIKSDLPDYLL